MSPLLSVFMDRYLSAVKSRKFLYHKDQVNLIRAIAKLFERRYLFISFFSRKKMNGLYIHGNVGSGKSTIVRMCISNVKKKVKRVHYNDFINEIHFFMQDFQHVKNPIPKIVDKLLNNVDIFYLDEMQIHDISDAMIFREFFKRIISKNIIFITTSNYEPDNLYENGIQRDSFVQTIELMKEEMSVIELRCPDHRSLKQNRKRGIYAIGENGGKVIFDEFNKISASQYFENVNLELSFGHSITLKRSFKTTALFTFNELCAKPLWTHDYSIIAKKFGFVFICDIPKFSYNNNDEARRFSMLVDELYNYGSVLFCSSDIHPNELYSYKNDNVSARTTSRINEMCSIMNPNDTI